MFNINQYFKSLEPYLKLEYLYQALISIIIAVILILSGVSLLQPIHATQYDNVVKLAQQHRYADTQRMAYVLLHEPEIKKAHYFNLIRAYQLEITQVKEYPALEPEQK